ncbi:MAG: hypothetical protein AB7P12_17805 [Alphaproteobacteria bacterium]
MAPSDENEPNGPFFLKTLGYSLLALVTLTMVWGAGFVWIRHGAAMAADMFAWGGRLSPLVVATFIGPIVTLIVVGIWMQRRVDRLNEPANDSGLAAAPRRRAQLTNLAMEQAADRLVASVTKNAEPVKRAALLLSDNDPAVADGLSRIVEAGETVVRLTADDKAAA